MEGWTIAHEFSHCSMRQLGVISTGGALTLQMDYITPYKMGIFRRSLLHWIAVNPKDLYTVQHLKYEDFTLYIVS